MQILEVEITGDISLNKSMSLRDELVENERATYDTCHQYWFRHFSSDAASKCVLGQNAKLSVATSGNDQNQGLGAARSFSTISSLRDMLPLSEM